MEKQKFKKGPFSKDEQAFMRKNAYAMSAAKIAEELNRPYERIYAFIEANVRPEIKQAIQGDVVYELKNSSDWLRLTKELTEDELLTFEDQYTQIIKQFQADVTYLEKQQIFQAIKFDIMMSRNLISRKKAEGDLEEIQNQYKKFMNQFGGRIDLMDQPDRDFQTTLLRSIQSLKGEIENKSTEYKILHEQYQKLMHAMKSTRDQRVDKRQQNKGTWMQTLEGLREEENNIKAGREAELARMALEKKMKEMMEPHIFMDGNTDSILTIAEK